ncbi:nitroreductase family protein [Carboxylicivirga marina]|uniref:Nitroreductase family protein n=1 Tax=Carboxylicivirga marina TaxID=2800988 RepID=A0ABS1HMK0_9BACT|nr:nitroreductase family protein [Carboxylicivirga marina]MBK3518488.1 nitroreductase family protein [Carboxylicivirga marina]
MVELNTENCIKCKKCEQICPVSGININENTINTDCIECHHCGAICQYHSINQQNTIGNNTQNNIQPFDFELLMQQRRTHRIFSAQAVAPEVLKEFIEHMRFSPTASNLQSLKFTVITNKSVLNEINILTIRTLTKAFNTVNSITRPLIRLFSGTRALNKMEQSKRKFLNKAELKHDMICYNAPALIVIHSEKSPVGMPCHDANIWTGMATLYAELLNLCTCINGYIVNAAKRNKKIKQLMHIPAEEEIYGTILIGYPKTKFEKRVQRKMPSISFISE